jgi:hypothetical protein
LSALQNNRRQALADPRNAWKVVYGGWDIYGRRGYESETDSVTAQDKEFFA